MSKLTKRRTDNAEFKSTNLEENQGNRQNEDNPRHGICYNRQCVLYGILDRIYEKYNKDMSVDIYYVT